MVVGWQASRSLRSNLAIDALEMTVHNRRRAGADLSQVTHHSDRGVQYLSFATRNASTTTRYRVGRRQGRQLRNAMIESFNGLHKWELI
jgi:putative transposase